MKPLVWVGHLKGGSGHGQKYGVLGCFFDVFCMGILETNVLRNVVFVVGVVDVCLANDAMVHSLLYCAFQLLGKEGAGRTTE